VLRRLARHDPRDWLLPAGLVLVLLGLHFAGPQLLAAFRYERSPVLAGEAWRLVTAHLVHHDFTHVGWNLAGVALVWLLFGREFTPRGWIAIMLASTAAIDLGFLLVEPQIEWYVGFSGVLHGCMAAGLVAWLRNERDALTALVAALFAAKLAWEHVFGPLPFTAGTLSIPVVHEAHTYGAIGGALAAMWLLRRRTVGRAASL
jgi:rhomboid family GlyGly-CTERM serine protease